MQFKTLILATLASVAVAQTATSTAASGTSTSTCDAQVILDSCIGTIQGQVNACNSSDYSCLCSAYENMLTCYNNCPRDAMVGTIQQQRQQNCNAASVYGSTTTLGTAPATSATATATSTGSDSDSTNSGFATGTSGSAGVAQQTGNAASALTATSGLLGLVAAGIAALL